MKMKCWVRLGISLGHRRVDLQHWAIVITMNIAWTSVTIAILIWQCQVCHTQIYTPTMPELNELRESTNICTLKGKATNPLRFLCAATDHSWRKGFGFPRSRRGSQTHSEPLRNITFQIFYFFYYPIFYQPQHIGEIKKNDP